MTNPSLHTRRYFLKNSILGGAVALTLPGFIHRTFAALDGAAVQSATQIATGKDNPILVIIQLAGGNDGLNTVIPFEDSAYFSARPKLAIDKNQVLPVTDGLGLNPKLSGFHRIIKDGDGAIIQGVGYPNPNRSHFRSMEIWQTATDANKTSTTGWLGRYFDNCCEGEEPAVAVSVGERMPQAFSATAQRGIAVRNPDALKNRGGVDESMMGEADYAMDGGSIGMLDGRVQGGGTSLDFIRRVALNAEVASDQIAKATAKYTGTTEYPQSGLGRDLRFVSQMIAGGMSTRIYYTGMGGFDTHANQGMTHDRLLGDFDAALSAFIKDLKEQGNFNRVTIMTFSEFGRRVKENASGGTDHGTAAPVFLAGAGITPGIFGNAPDLSDLDKGDLKFSVDFRRIYSALLESRLKVPHEQVLGARFTPLEIIKA
jgi:uncharacterized protein (DUF1501 family)